MFLRHSKPLSGFTTLIRMLLQGIFEKIFKSCYIFLKSQKMLLHVKNSFFWKKKMRKKAGGPNITIFRTLITLFHQQIFFLIMFFKNCWAKIITKIFCGEKITPWFLIYSNLFAFFIFFDRIFLKKSPITFKHFLRSCIKELPKNVNFSFQSFNVSKILLG